MTTRTPARVVGLDGKTYPEQRTNSPLFAARTPVVIEDPCRGATVGPPAPPWGTDQ